MALFRRSRGERPAGPDRAQAEFDANDDRDLSQAVADEDVDEAAVDGEPSPETDSEPGQGGPYDRADVPGPQGRLRLGSLWLPAFPGMQLRFDFESEQGEVTAVTVISGDFSAQLQAFAAPKSSGVWEEIRAEIAESVAAAGGAAQEQSGPWGTELLARLPAAGPDGRASHQPARFIGVDGPRWFLRAVLTGAAATDAASAEPLLGVIRGAVVVRGDAAMAPRELLPLSVPEEIEPPAPSPRPAAPLSPFQRGPEITEIR
jgi:hypothetical protein